VQVEATLRDRLWTSEGIVRTWPLLPV
jgi:hypothetical protein